MHIRFWKKENSLPTAQSEASGQAAPRRLTHRAFLKGLVAAVGGAGLGQLVGRATPASATYTPGTPSDTVDTNLTVQGNLIVGPSGQSSMAVGTSTTQGKLHVAGDIWVNGTQAVDANGVVKESYYAQ